MGQTKSLIDREAIEKIKELAHDKICLFCTYDDNGIQSRPMGTMAIDDDGTIWFFSRRDSNKNREVKEDRRVYLMYMESGKSHYLSLSGMAKVVIDDEKTEELWKPMVKAWFEQGKDDPELTLIRVTPEEGHYWDTTNGRLVSLFKIAVAAVTGSQMDGGVEGNINIR